MSNENVTVGMKEVMDLFADYLTPADIIAAQLMTQVSIAVTRERLKLGMNQTQFAEHIGVKQSQISRWECGYYNFSLRKIAEIASLLDLDVSLQITPFHDSPDPAEKNSETVNAANIA